MAEERTAKCPTCNGTGNEYSTITHPAANVAGWYYLGNDRWVRVCQKCRGSGIARSPVPLIKKGGS